MPYGIIGLERVNDNILSPSTSKLVARCTNCTTYLICLPTLGQSFPNLSTDRNMYGTLHFW